ncbi:MAG: hypothetical protein EOO01_17930 [Chitinophagaceae bacterium]|nr:MAG: hypothetical protein EOO01_17930 [Chitinophagaceae bacterium]
MITSVEDNYVGFSDKVGLRDRRNYQLFKDSLRGCSNKSGYGCFFLMKKYVQYFNDPHLAFTIGSIDGKPIDTALVRRIFKSVPIKDITYDDVVQYLNKNSADNMEGIWKNPSLPYAVAILKDSGTGNEYTGYALGTDSLYWYQGQIKMSLSVTGNRWTIIYHRNDHSPDVRKMEVQSGIMNITGYSSWEKVYPRSSGTPLAPKPKAVLSFNILSDSACAIVLPDFKITSKHAIDSVVKKNIEAISRSKYFLIDIRNNGGGSLLSADILFPLIASGSFIEDGFIVRSSKDNIRTYQKYARDSSFLPDAQQAFLDIATKMETHGNGLVQISKTDTINTTQAPIPYPSRIGILTNEGTMSAAELFTLRSRQSEKVTVFGSRSRGALDYTESDIKRLPCPYFIYSCPIGMSDHTVTPYIDNVGIQPDIEIPDTTTDWMAYALKYLTQADALKRKSSKP